MPTRDSNHPAMLLEYDGWRLLFDCGEGTQRQLLKIGVHPVKVDVILLTHWHADHSAGLLPLLQSMELDKRVKELLIIGPVNTSKYLRKLMSVYGSNFSFKLVVKECNSGFVRKVFEGDGFVIRAVRVDHDIPCINYCFQERDRVRINLDYTKRFGLVKHKLLGDLQRRKDIVFNGKRIKWRDATFIVKGRKVSYVTDTAYTDKLVSLVNDSDLLVCEATFSKRDCYMLERCKHLTTEQAGELAVNSNSKKLVVTHFSKRYKNKGELLEEVRRVFPNTVLGRDFLELTLPKNYGH